MRLTPLFPLAACLALGEALSLVVPGAAGLWPWTLAATVAVILFGYGWRVPAWGFAATALLGFSVGGSHLADRLLILDAVSLQRGPFVCEATLRETPRGRGEWLSADVTAAGFDLRVVFPGGSHSRATASGASDASEVPASVADAVARERDPPRAGDVWRFAGWLERKPLTDFSRRKLWIKGRGTEARLVRAAGRWTPAAVFARVRADLSRRLGIGLGHAPRVADLNRAILLGERRGLDRGTRDAFAAAGTTHVFAISGLHVMCVAAVLFYALVACGVPTRARPFALVPPLWFYVFLVGAAPSAVRAAAMASLVLFAPVFWRRADALAAWSVVFLAVHLADPFRIAHVGSCLSFAVMLTLILFGRWYREVVPSRRGELLAMSVATWAAGVPIVACVFGRFTPGAVLANLVLLPTAGVSVLASALAVAASFVSETLAAYCNNAAALATSAMVGVSRLTAALPGASAEVAPWTPGECVAWYVVLILLLYLVRSVVLRRRAAL